MLLCGKHKVSKFGALGAGIGGGMALNQCAIDFNKISAREQRVLQAMVGDKDDFGQRLDSVRSEFKSA